MGWPNDTTDWLNRCCAVIALELKSNGAHWFHSVSSPLTHLFRPLLRMCLSKSSMALSLQYHWMFNWAIYRSQLSNPLWKLGSTFRSRFRHPWQMHSHAWLLQLTAIAVTCPLLWVTRFGWVRGSFLWRVPPVSYLLCGLDRLMLFLVLVV